MKRRFGFLGFFGWLAFSVPGLLHAQDLTGIWRGHFRSNEGFERMMAADDRYKIEVQIAQTQQLFHAVTYSYRSTEFYGKADASGSVNAKSKKVLLRESKLLEVRMAGGDVCIMTCFLQYSRLGDEEFLQGTYTSVSTQDSSSGCGKGIIFLHKVLTSDFQKEPFLVKKEKELKSVAREPVKRPAPARNKPVSPPIAQKKSPAPKPAAKTGKTVLKSDVPSSQPQKRSLTIVPEQRHLDNDSALKIEKKTIPMIIPRVLTTRSNDLVKNLTVNNTEVNLDIYDDGAIDNDTVSVYYDHKLIISKARISDLPLKATIRVEPSDHPHELVMVAENLGDIPPNTSLMVVRDGAKKYEIRIVSTEQKNAMITFSYKKIE